MRMHALLIEFIKKRIYTINMIYEISIDQAISIKLIVKIIFYTRI